ncbi:bifunctional diguanylate cyclase/phosphodiesterase [Rhodovulum sp. ES.010]|uniref:putative bifunctional diguanylate cyclase/phosphodiesterase n=1 Tax=Rhodovulum sp. ES.010 TaxID=1882821 RepID=UPI000940694C|nr:EAL domain-containing protein [Rhodovulum sp. ES.010]
MLVAFKDELTESEPARLSRTELELQNQELLASWAATQDDLHRYLTIFENLPLPALVLDRRGVIRESNEAAAPLFGVVAADFLANRSIYRHMVQEARGRLHAVLSAMPHATSPTVARRLVERRLDGTVLSYDAHITPLPAGADEDRLALMVFVDQTATNRLEHEGHLWKSVGEATSTLIYAFDTSGNLIFANAATQDRIGRPGRLTGQHRSKYENLVGSWTLDVEVLVSGQPRNTFGAYIDAAGHARTIHIHKFPLLDEGGRTYAIGGISTDVSDMDHAVNPQQALDRFAELSMRDPLTGLYNRPVFLEKLRDQIETSRGRGGQIVVGFVDIDGFKDVNDSMGHDAGDGVLCAFAHQLSAAIGDRGHVARYGGDEFILYLVDMAPCEAERLLQSALDEIRSTTEIDGIRILLTFSAGLSHFPEDARCAEDLLNAADNALYSAKLGGRDRISRFSKELRVASERRLRVLSALRQALAEDRFRLMYQPKFEISGTGRIVGGEALLRWRDPILGEVAPSEFVPLAETNGLYKALDLRVLKLFAEQQRVWLGQGLRIPVSVNIAARSLQSTDFVPTVLSLLNLYDVPGDLLSLEITETGLMNSPLEAAKALAILAEAGIRISIDDFGTGYSSLSYLQKLNPSELKIDRSFISKLDQDEGRSHAIVRAILALSESLGLQSVAEGIETEGQLAWLADNGCDLGQGYLVRPALEADEFAAFRSDTSPK